MERLLLLLLPFIFGFSFPDFIEGGTLVTSGNCLYKQVPYECAVIHKDGKNFLAIATLDENEEVDVKFVLDENGKEIFNYRTWKGKIITNRPRI